jgi:hypothetical protein
LLSDCQLFPAGAAFLTVLSTVFSSFFLRVVAEVSADDDAAARAAAQKQALEVRVCLGHMAVICVFDRSLEQNQSTSHSNTSLQRNRLTSTLGCF